MDTESPAQRLTRRIGAAPDAGSAEAPTPAPEEEADTSLSRWLPEHPPGSGDWIATLRADPGRAGVIALIAVGVLAVLVTVFTLMRDRTPPVASANLPSVQMVSSATPTQPAADGPVVVSVVGLVHKPGLVTLISGARIADALEAAGGALDGADLVGLNMARRIVDGEQIIVGITGAPGAPSPMGSSVTSNTVAAPAQSGGGPAGAKGTAPSGAAVDLNAATAEDLDALPGVGPVTAAAIIAWREAHGRFGSVDQLGEVDGIGPARLEKLRNLVHV